MSPRLPAALAEAARKPGLPPVELACARVSLSRRALVLGMLSAPWASLAAEGQRPAARFDDSFWAQPRELWLHRNDTRQQVRVVYWKDGVLVPEGYWQACALMRDVRANVMTAMDPVLLDVMYGVLGYYRAWGWPYPLVVNSGYRTEKTNQSLRAEGAARNSMHLYGRAVDLYMPGVPIADVGRLALYFRQGGVGFYENKRFVHLDSGRLRAWRG